MIKYALVDLAGSKTGVEYILSTETEEPVNGIYDIIISSLKERGTYSDSELNKSKMIRLISDFKKSLSSK